VDHVTPSTGSQVLVERTAPNAVRSDAAEIRAFAKCRNERVRLPAFLDHYRSIGVDRFFVVDNDSSDGSFEYLKKQPDVQLFQTANSFREARGGVDWLNALLGEFGVGGWCLTVDIDELLVYPGSDRTPLRTLAGYLDRNGFEALASMQLDMYPSETLDDRSYVNARDLIDASPYFDPGPYERVATDLCPGMVIRGGMRERVFYPQFRSRGALARMYESLRGRAARRVPRLHRLRQLRPRAAPPVLTKVPLVRWDAASRYLSPHWLTNKVVAPDSGVLLHFKFLGGFRERAVAEAARGEYHDDASEYRQYVEAIGKTGTLNLMCDRSTRFNGPDQLVAMNLMRETADWSIARATKTK